MTVFRLDDNIATNTQTNRDELVMNYRLRQLPFGHGIVMRQIFNAETTHCEGKTRNHTLIISIPKSDRLLAASSGSSAFRIALITATE